MSEQLIVTESLAADEYAGDPFGASNAGETLGEPTLGQTYKRRRTSRVDIVLAQAKDIALEGIEQIAPKNSIGLLHHLRGEEERLTTHLFECTMVGYRGWFWFATLARAPRSKIATVCEVGLLPGDDALLAPDWVPWSQRLQEAEEHEGEEAEGIAADVDTEETAGVELAVTEESTGTGGQKIAPQGSKKKKKQAKAKKTRKTAKKKAQKKGGARQQKRSK